MPSYFGMEVGDGLADLPHEEAALLLGQRELRRYHLLEKLAAVQVLRQQTNLSEKWRANMFFPVYFNF